MTLASSRSRDSSPRASSAVDCRANGEAGATAREIQHTHTHTHTHGEKHASIRLNTTEGDARHSWRVDYTGSASRCARERARRMRAARRRPPVLFARRSRALSSRDETRTERNGVDRVLDDADEIQKTERPPTTDDDDDDPRRRRRDDYRARMASRDEVRSIDATTRDAMRDETRTTMRSVGGVNFKLFSRRRRDGARKKARTRPRRDARAEYP